MLDKPQGLRERNRIRTREEILIAMSVLLGERGYDAITIDDVANRAGVSRGTIYTYFPEGREQLVREAYLRIAEQVDRDGMARHELVHDTTERIIGFATALVTVASTPEGRFYGIMGPDIMGTIASVAGTSSSAFHRVLIADLTTAQARGELDPSAPAEELAVSLLGAVREIGVVAAREPERVPRLLQGLRLICNAVLTH